MALAHTLRRGNVSDEAEVFYPQILYVYTHTHTPTHPHLHTHTHTQVLYRQILSEFPQHLPAVEGLADLLAVCISLSLSRVSFSLSLSRALSLCIYVYVGGLRLLLAAAAAAHRVHPPNYPPTHPPTTTNTHPHHHPPTHPPTSTGPRRRRARAPMLPKCSLFFPCLGGHERQPPPPQSAGVNLGQGDGARQGKEECGEEAECIASLHASFGSFLWQWCGDALAARTQEKKSLEKPMS